VPVLGVIENMAGFACPECRTVTAILGSGGGLRMATEMGVPYLGAIPNDPQIATAGDNGSIPVQETPLGAAGRSISEIAGALAAALDGVKAA
jgi:ATP-binding protein involved in chromosome partitioning